MIRFKKLFLTGLLSILAGGVPLSVAQADKVPYDRALIAKPASTTEDIGIAFLKTAGNSPDFAKVVEASDAYAKLNPLAQADYKAKMVNKLQLSYTTFSQKKSDIIVRVKVNVLFTKLANGEGVLKLRTFPNDPVYFPFYFAKYPIAMIIKDMEMFKEIHLSREETDIVYSRLSLSGDATLLLQLYAVAANDQKPMVLDDIPQFPLLTDIGYIGLLNNCAEQIWAWKNNKFGKKETSIIGERNISDFVPEDKSFNQK